MAIFFDLLDFDRHGSLIPTHAVVDKVNCSGELGKVGGVFTLPPNVMKRMPRSMDRKDLRTVVANLLPVILELFNLVHTEHCHHVPQEVVVNEV